QVPDVPVVMTHFLRPVEGGSELRSRFWFGWQIIDGEPVKCIPDGFKIPAIGPVSLLKHNVKEFTNLACILPDIYAEEKDNWF
ncbi:MAG: DAPG hydrolase family protein, partial [Promethearchaeota archaeon]